MAYYRYGADSTDNAMPSISTQPACVVIDYYEEPPEPEKKTVKKGRKYRSQAVILLGNLTSVAAVVEQEQERRRCDSHIGQVPHSLAWAMKRTHTRRRIHHRKRGTEWAIPWRLRFWYWSPWLPCFSSSLVWPGRMRRSWP